MIAHLAQAVGAPCPTLVLDATRLPADEWRLRAALAAIRRRLPGRVLKFALLRPSGRPGYDLDYRFVQALPGRAERFDFGAACGHSGLAAALVAARWGWVRAGAPVRLRARGGALLVEPCGPGEFTLHYEPAAGDLLPTGRPREVLRTAVGAFTASLVALGNPYVFLDAAELHLPDSRALFAAGPAVAARLAPIRAAAAALLGLPAAGALPKLALVTRPEPAGLPVRALTPTGWHPTLALTGAVCLAAALTLPGTLPHHLAAPGTPFLTPAGPTAVTVESSGPQLSRVSVPHKRARLIGAFALTPEHGVRPAA
ncbi:PrpF domain-containing protein [Kitasatospora sp. NPDC048296]|uniref:PrpF domain-containing protein n=1 Tax=Kitasatospora sp. NPDC048296 TaxID=3364048 RepID=UPI00371E8B8D